MTWRRLVADDCLCAASTEATMLQDILHRPDYLKRRLGEISDFDARIPDDSAVVRYRVTEYSEVAGQRIAMRQRRVESYQRRAGAWILVGGIDSALPVDPPAVAVAAETYDELIGRYVYGPGVVDTINREGDRLMVQRVARVSAAHPGIVAAHPGAAFGLIRATVPAMEADSFPPSAWFDHRFSDVRDRTAPSLVTKRRSGGDIPVTTHAAFSQLGAALALAFLPLPAEAQHTAQDLQHAAASLDCRQLAAMPNPPMTVEACEAQKAAFGNLGAAAASPGSTRPSDASMSCAQIIAELQSSDISGVSAATAAEGAAAGEHLREAMASNQARAMGLAASQTAGTAAASAGPNAMQGAVALKHEAEQKALRQSAMAEIRPAQTRAGLANAASAQELAVSLQANPRVAMLIQLAAARNCQVP